MTDYLYAPSYNPYNFPGGLSPVGAAYVLNTGASQAPLPLQKVHTSDVNDLVGKLEQRKAAEAMARLVPRQVLSKAAFAGDTGGLRRVIDSQAPQRAVAVKTVDPAVIAELSQQISAKQLEVSVLNAEVDRAVRQVVRLQTQFNNRQHQLVEASSHLGTLSMKVEAQASNRVGVMEASVDKLQEIVDLYRNRRDHMQGLLGEKDAEINVLYQVVEAARAKVASHFESVQSMREGAGEIFAPRSDPSLGAASLASWKAQREAMMEQDKLDAEHARERRRVATSATTVESEIARVKWQMASDEDKIRLYVASLGRGNQRLEAMAMEEKLRSSAAELGKEQAEEKKKVLVAESRLLEEKIQDERARRADHDSLAVAYDSLESEVLPLQTQLSALTLCLREITRTLRTSGPGSHGNQVDQEMERWAEEFRRKNGQDLGLVRVYPGVYAVAGEQFPVAISEGGQLCVRVPQGGLVPLDEYLHKTLHAIPAPVRLVPSP